jgi:hypothetical protein
LPAESGARTPVPKYRVFSATRVLVSGPFRFHMSRRLSTRAGLKNSRSSGHERTYITNAIHVQSTQGPFDLVHWRFGVPQNDDHRRMPGMVAGRSRPGNQDILSRQIRSLSSPRSSTASLQYRK